MAIDTDEEEIEHVLPYTVNSMIGDGTNKEFIRSLGPETFDICFVTIGDCFQTSLLATYTLKACGAKQVVARASDEVQGIRSGRWRTGRRSATVSTMC